MSDYEYCDLEENYNSAQEIEIDEYRDYTASDYSRNSDLNLNSNSFSNSPFTSLDSISNSLTSNTNSTPNSTSSSKSSSKSSLNSDKRDDYSITDSLELARKNLKNKMLRNSRNYHEKRQRRWSI